MSAAEGQTAVSGGDNFLYISGTIDGGARVDVIEPEGKKIRSLESICTKRKRYRQKKKARKKEAWEVQIEKELCQRWRERRLRYEADNFDMNSSEAASKQTTSIKHATTQKVTEHNRSFYDKRSKKAPCLSEATNESIENTTDKEAPYDTLQLPFVRVPECKYETAQEIKSKIPIAALSSLDSVDVVSYIQTIQEKATNALCLAQHYRDVAEKMRKEKLEVNQVMNKKVECARNFWRNGVMEGKTRAGRILQKSLCS